MPRSDTDTHGWQRMDNWLPFPPDAEKDNATTMADDHDSIFSTGACSYSGSPLRR